MELTAALKGLQALRRPCRVDLYSNSSYLTRGISGWIKNWQKDNTVEKRANADIWLKLIELDRTHKIETHWLKNQSQEEEYLKCKKLVHDQISKHFTWQDSTNTKPPI
jgi:ribonuclease HI